MGEWADEFRARFDSDKQEARIRAELALRKSDEVKNKAGKLWAKLMQLAEQAVDDINESGRDSVLNLRAPDISVGNKNDFAIVYVRNGETRESEAKFNRSTNAVVVIGRNGRREFTISANDSLEVEFFLNVPYKPETIIKEMIGNLL